MFSLFFSFVKQIEALFTSFQSSLSYGQDDHPMVAKAQAAKKNNLFAAFLSAAVVFEAGRLFPAYQTEVGTAMAIIYLIFFFYLMPQ